MALKKFKLKGGEHECIVQQFQGPVKDIMEKHGNKLRPWKEGDPDPGFIMGSAIHFIPLFLYDREDDRMIDSDGKERFTCSGPWAHDHLINWLRHSDVAMAVQAHDCEQTVYGFVTSEGFFVDREQGGKIWQTMLKTAGWRDPSFEGEFPSRLYSYCYKPEVIEHHHNPPIEA